MAKYAYHQVDANADALYKYAARLGMTIHRIGRPLDALVCFARHTALVEVKQPGKKLRPSQKKFWIEWPGRKYIWETERDVVFTRNELISI